MLVDSDIAPAAIVAFLQALRLASPRSKIILLASSFDGHTLLACSQIGIEGYLTWRALTSTAVVLHCLTAVVEGGLHVRCPDAVATLRDAVQAHPAPPAALAALSEKERMVLSGLVAGLSQPDIVDQTHLSLRTVERTVAGLKEKLDVPTTSVLVMKAAGLHHPPA